MRLGLVARTGIWTALWLALALTTAALSYTSLQRLQAELDTLVHVEFDELMKSVRLMQQTEVLIARSLLLTQVGRQEDRRRLRVEIQDNEDWIRKIIAQKRAQNQADPGLIGRVQAAQERLSQGVSALHRLVRQRLALADRTAELRVVPAADRAELAHLNQQIAGVAERNQSIAADLSVLMGYFRPRCATKRAAGSIACAPRCSSSNAGCWA
ncbi:MAG: hypothetical protein Fur007_18840 [Rhodoferax sp.]